MKALLLLTCAAALASCDKPADLEAQRAIERENARLAARVEALELKNEKLSAESEEARNTEAREEADAVLLKLEADNAAMNERVDRVLAEGREHQRMQDRAARLLEKMEGIRESK